MGFLLALFPGRLWGYLAIAAVIFGLGGTAAYKVQAWRITNIKAEHTQAIAKAAAQVVAAEKANQLKQIEAQNAKSKRQAINQTAAANARAELYSLRNATNAYIAKTPPSTCNVRAETAAVVFSQCADELTKMAEIADRLESDRQLLLDSWPK